MCMYAEKDSIQGNLQLPTLILHRDIDMAVSKWSDAIEKNEVIPRAGCCSLIHS